MRCNWVRFTDGIHFFARERREEAGAAGDTSNSFSPPPEDREDAQSFYDLAIAYMGMGAYRRALDELAKLRCMPHRAVEALSLMASCKVALGSASEAALDLEEAIRCAGDQVYAAVPLRYELGQVLLGMNRRERAREILREVAALGPGYRDVESQLAAIEGS